MINSSILECLVLLMWCYECSWNGSCIFISTIQRWYYTRKNERVEILPSILECQHSQQYLCTDSFHYILHLATDNRFIVNKLSSSTSNISGQVWYDSAVAKVEVGEAIFKCALLYLQCNLLCIKYAPIVSIASNTNNGQKICTPTSYQL